MNGIVPDEVFLANPKKDQIKILGEIRLPRAVYPFTFSLTYLFSISCAIQQPQALGRRDQEV